MPEVSPWRFAGYGTLGYNWDSQSSLAPIRDVSQRPAEMQNTGPGWSMDSRVGVQFAYRFNPQAEFVAQAVARDQVTSNLNSAVDLAYLELLPRSDTKLRLGRVGYDALLMSDHRNLGYSYAWVRPPRELYGWVPLFSVDGVDVTRDIPDGDATWRVKAQIAKGQLVIPMGENNYEFQADRLWSISLLRQSGPWRIKTGASRMYIGTDAAPLAPLRSGLDKIAATNIPGIATEAATLRKEVSFEGATLDYVSLGAAFDDGVWLGQAEFAYSRASTNIAPQSNMGYLAAGRRFGAFTPFAMISASRPRDSKMSATADWGRIGLEALQNTAYYVVNSTRFDQETLSLGLRWDFDPRAALKLQWDHSRIHPYGYALWFRDNDFLLRSTSVNLLTLAVDFIF